MTVASADSRIALSKTAKANITKKSKSSSGGGMSRNHKKKQTESSNSGSRNLNGMTSQPRSTKA
jgi:hypothetical protein